MLYYIIEKVQKPNELYLFIDKKLALIILLKELKYARFKELILKNITFILIYKLILSLCDFLCKLIGMQNNKIMTF